MQIAISENTFALIDAIPDGVVKALEPVLSSREIVKTMHDCREDSAALFHQFGIKLECVADTQVSNLLIQRQTKIPLHQLAYSDLLHRYLGQPMRESTDMKQKMLDDPFLWHRRPLPGELVKYALHGVEFLKPLFERMQAELEILNVSKADVMDASSKWMEYRELNANLGTKEVEKIGAPLLGMVASINDRGVYFKLNLARTGVCTTPSALKRMLNGSGGFPPVQVGDIVELAVSGISLDGKVLYVDRLDPDWEYFDFLRRPHPGKRGTSVQEYRHNPSIVEHADIDPLLRRGLGPDGTIDSDDEGEIDHETILTRKPRK
jgi:hypothetical protein